MPARKTVSFSDIITRAEPRRPSIYNAPVRQTPNMSASMTRTYNPPVITTATTKLPPVQAPRPPTRMNLPTAVRPVANTYRPHQPVAQRPSTVVYRPPQPVTTRPPPTRMNLPTAVRPVANTYRPHQPVAQRPPTVVYRPPTKTDLPTVGRPLQTTKARVKYVPPPVTQAKPPVLWPPIYDIHRTRVKYKPDPPPYKPDPPPYKPRPPKPPPTKGPGGGARGPLKRTRLEEALRILPPGFGDPLWNRLKPRFGDPLYNIYNEIQPFSWAGDRLIYGESMSHGRKLGIPEADIEKALKFGMDTWFAQTYENRDYSVQDLAVRERYVGDLGDYLGTDVPRSREYRYILPETETLERLPHWYAYENLVTKELVDRIDHWNKNKISRLKLLEIVAGQAEYTRKFLWSHGMASRIKLSTETSLCAIPIGTFLLEENPIGEVPASDVKRAEMYMSKIASFGFSVLITFKYAPMINEPMLRGRDPRDDELTDGGFTVTMNTVNKYAKLGLYGDVDKGFYIETESDIAGSPDMVIDRLVPVTVELTFNCNNGGAYTGLVIANYPGDVFFNEMPREAVKVLNTLQVYGKELKDTPEPCLISALKYQLKDSDITDEEIEGVCLESTLGGMVPNSELSTVADSLGIQIRLSCLEKNYVQVYGRSEKEVKLLYIDNHFAPVYSLDMPAKTFGIEGVTRHNIVSTTDLMRKLKYSCYMRPPTDDELLLRAPLNTKQEHEKFEPWMLELNRREVIKGLVRDFKGKTLKEFPFDYSQGITEELEGMTSAQALVGKLSVAEHVYDNILAKPSSRAGYIRITLEDDEEDYGDEAFHVQRYDQTGLKALIAAKTQHPPRLHQGNFCNHINSCSYGLDIETFNEVSNGAKVSVFSVSVEYPPPGPDSDSVYRTFYTNPDFCAITMALDSIAYHHSKLTWAIRKAQLASGGNLGTFKAGSLPNRGRPLILAHNMKFDVSGVLSNDRCSNVKDVIGNKQMTFTWKTIKDAGTYEMVIRDTYCLIPAKLSDFGSMFGLKSFKAPFPYDYFNESRCRALIDGYWCAEGTTDVPVKDFAVGCSEDSIREACKNMDFYNEEDDTVYVAGYVAYYNEMDVRVMMEGVRKFRSIFMDSLGVDVSTCLTIGSVSQKILKDYKVNDGIEELHGPLSEYVRTNMEGGMVQVRDNTSHIQITKVKYDGLKVIYENQSTGCHSKEEDPYRNKDVGGNLKQIIDLDVNSEYPWAQSQGLPGGCPWFVDPTEYDTNEKLESIMGRWPMLCSIIIHRLPKALPVSYVAGVHPRTGTRRFLQTMEPGQEIRKLCSTDTLKILQSYQGMSMDAGDFTITSMVVWPYVDYTLGVMTERLYSMRADAKRGGNMGLSNAMKLVLNNIWGKFAQRTYNETVEYTRTFEEALDRARELSSKVSGIKEYQLNGSRMTTIRYIKKHIPKHSSFSHCAVYVLEMAKSLIASYQQLAEEVGMILLYTDTDSIHLLFATDERLEAFRLLCIERIGNDPFALDKNGNDILGNLKSDYKLESGTLPTGVKLDKSYKWMKADAAIFRDPKTYCARVVFHGDDGNTYHQMHLRSKGINKDTLCRVIEQEPGETFSDRALNLYTRMAEGDEVVFATELGFKHTACGSVYKPTVRRINPGGRKVNTTKEEELPEVISNDEGKGKEKEIKRDRFKTFKERQRTYRKERQLIDLKHVAAQEAYSQRGESSDRRGVQSLEEEEDSF